MAHTYYEIEDFRKKHTEAYKKIVQIELSKNGYVPKQELLPFLPGQIAFLTESLGLVLYGNPVFDETSDSSDGKFIERSAVMSRFDRGDDYSDVEGLVASLFYRDALKMGSNLTVNYSGTNFKRDFYEKRHGHSGQTTHTPIIYLAHRRYLPEGDDEEQRKVLRDISDSIKHERNFQIPKLEDM